ncbi:hypothetical protein VTK56DRAFT_2583 [Thermocarpiscus australiensis]
MFKLDFFEYYMLIERALVHLLSVFGVDIPRGHAYSHPHPRPQSWYSSPSKWDGANGERGRGLEASIWKEAPRHRYHANVLAALDREDNPLHATLGTGEVRRQLGRAKDLRNRWKTAGDDPDGDDRGAHESATGPEREWHTKKVPAPLETYDLEHMLEVIFDGLEKAFKVAERFVRGDAQQGAETDADMLDEDGKTLHGAAAEDEEDQWEFMVDAMDWEAV